MHGIVQLVLPPELESELTARIFNTGIGDGSVYAMMIFEPMVIP